MKDSKQILQLVVKVLILLAIILVLLWLLFT